MFTATCGRCKKVFDKDTKGQPYRSQARADQALAMHKGRIHSKVIPTYTGGPRPRHSLVRVGAGNFNGLDVKPGNTVEAFVERRGRKGKLSAEQSNGLIDFIRANRDQFPSKSACFTAALEAVGVARLIRNNSVAVCRYFAKAEGRPTEYEKRKARLNGRNMAVALVDPPAQLVVTHRHGTLVKQCPRCGLVIDGAEDIFQLLQDNPEVVHLALAAARKMMARKMNQVTT